MVLQKLGRYEIKKELGHGGMATVYLADDPELNRKVAIKVLSSKFSDDSAFKDRFRREAKTIIRLEHRAVVPVYDLGEYEDNLYLVMRFMEGGSLADRLEQGPLSMSETCSIIQRICAALDKAHRDNIVHRDLKPANIMFDSEGAAYLGDFGIARSQDDTQITQTGAFMGTPAYMSPEQCQGKRDIDHRSDIYSLGIILFEMLTGQLPFQAKDIWGWISVHCNSPVPNPRLFIPELPETVSNAIKKAMAKSPGDRHDTASELSTAFEAISMPSPLTPVGPDGDVIKPRPVPPEEEKKTLLWLRRLSSEPRIRVALCLFIILALLEGDGAATQEPSLPTVIPSEITFTIICSSGPPHTIAAGETISLGMSNAVFIEPNIAPEGFEALTGELRQEPSQEKVFSYTPGNRGGTLVFTFINSESEAMMTKILNITVDLTSPGLCS